MNPRRQILALAAASAVTALLALPAAAPAEYYVPPANSAANQYTESIPGAGGESGGPRKTATPGATLGAGNARQLEEEGKAGEEAAEVAAETSPGELAGGRSGNGWNGGGEEEGSSSSTKAAGGSGGGSHGGKGGGAGNVQQPPGSSGLGQVLGQATGTDDGNLGLWLPLAIALTLIGSVAYGVRTRNAQAGRQA